jgi:hypothetical protein
MMNKSFSCPAISNWVSQAIEFKALGSFHSCQVYVCRINALMPWVDPSWTFFLIKGFRCQRMLAVRSPKHAKPCFGTTRHEGVSRVLLPEEAGGEGAKPWISSAELPRQLWLEINLVCSCDIYGDPSAPIWNRALDLSEFPRLLSYIWIC